MDFLRAAIQQRGNLPDFHAAIFHSGGRQQFSVGTEGKARNIALMAVDRGDFAIGFPLPEGDPAVLTAPGQAK